MTKAFNFPLQKVLNVRTMVEDAKAIELQKAQAEIERERQNLSSIQAEKETAVQSDKTADTGGQLSLHQLSNRMEYVDQLNEQIEKQGEVIARSQEDAEVQRQAFVQASKEKMVIEKLKEHHQEAFKKKSNQDQVKAESEVASRISQNESGL